MEQTSSERLNEVGQPIVTEIPDVSEYTPTQIRESIQWLVAKDNVERAQQVAEASLQFYPDNEEVLAISALVAVVRQSWEEAIELLKKLHGIQGEGTAALTYSLLVRSLRCVFNPVEAFKYAKEAMVNYPENLEILMDCVVLGEQMHDWNTVATGMKQVLKVKGGEATEDDQIRLNVALRSLGEATQRITVTPIF